jgi:hypothetical protein
MKRWIFRIASLLLALANLAFIMWFFIFDRADNNVMKNQWIPFLISSVVIIASICCIRLSCKKGLSWVAISGFCIGALLLSLTNGYLYYKYFPKYTRQTPYKIVCASPLSHLYEVDGLTSVYNINGNPFAAYGYAFMCNSINYISGGFVSGKVWIDVDPVTGECKKDNNAETSLDKKSLHFASFGYYGVFLPSEKKGYVNLYIRENSTSRGEWRSSEDETYEKWRVDNEDSLVTALPRLEADDVKAFIHDTGEKEVMNRLQECLNSLLGQYEKYVFENKIPSADLEINIMLYGADFATYKNGSITLLQ